MQPERAPSMSQVAREREWCDFNPLRFDFDLGAPGALPSW